jgi:site-specific recombinase XerD
VFKLKTYESTARLLKEWVKASGVTKNVTWHSARHSVATNLLINGVDLKTVSSILTHSTIKHTTKYLHLVDEIKKAALDSIPDYDPE